jgi:hypothetical protein
MATLLFMTPCIFLCGYMVAEESPNSEEMDDILVVPILRVFYALSVQMAKQNTQVSVQKCVVEKVPG